MDGLRRTDAVRRFTCWWRQIPDLEALKRRGLQAEGIVHLQTGAYIDTAFPELISFGDRSGLSLWASVHAHDVELRERTGRVETAPVRIGRLTFIGARAVVLPGATIGHRCVIGAGSVVRGDIPDGSLAVGRPARVVGDTETYAAVHARRIQERPDDYVR